MTSDAIQERLARWHYW